ncbi:MAG: glutamate-1-semialdehyde 2,1-aminomutase, partial [Gammaproteobacteria bacterium]
MNLDSLTLLIGASASAYLVLKAHRRLQLSRAKHPGLSGHVRMAKRVSKLIPHYSLEGDSFFNCDGANDALVEKRRKGFQNLSQDL